VHWIDFLLPEPKSRFNGSTLYLLEITNELTANIGFALSFSGDSVHKCSKVMQFQAKDPANCLGLQERQGLLSCFDLAERARCHTRELRELFRGKFSKLPSASECNAHL
jgi:hypothetical protein